MTDSSIYFNTSIADVPDENDGMSSVFILIVSDLLNCFIKEIVEAFSL